MPLFCPSGSTSRSWDGDHMRKSDNDLRFGLKILCLRVCRVRAVYTTASIRHRRYAAKPYSTTATGRLTGAIAAQLAQQRCIAALRGLNANGQAVKDGSVPYWSQRRALPRRGRGVPVLAEAGVQAVGGSSRTGGGELTLGRVWGTRADWKEKEREASVAAAYR